MEFLAKIEGFLEAMIEGVFRRFSRGSTHPVEIARRLYRTMENERRISVLRTYVPNEYRVALHPDDMQSFSSLARALSVELCQTVTERAERERYSFVGPVKVEFVADGSLRPGSVRVDAAFVEGDLSQHMEDINGDRDLRLPGSTRPLPEAKVREELEEDTAPHDAVRTGDTKTFAVPGEDMAASGGERRPPCGVPRLILSGDIESEGSGEEFSITGDCVTLGRASSNCVVIRDSSISREHAEIRREGEKYILRDLGSTNGTFVNGRRIAEYVLQDGDVLEIGKSRLVFRIR